MTRATRLAIFLLCSTAIPRAALADVTAFVGAWRADMPFTGSADTRRALGAAVGSGLLVVGFEFEFAQTDEDINLLQPGIRTLMGNLLVQTPLPIHGIQFYGTAGAGVYQERFSDELSSGLRLDNHFNVGTNLGGGAKITLAGPLRVRLDYRVFVLRNPDRAAENAQRFYAGLNLAF